MVLIVINDGADVRLFESYKNRIPFSDTTIVDSATRVSFIWRNFASSK